MHFMRNIAIAAAGFTASACAAEYSMAVNTSASGLDINNLGVTGLVSYANSSIWIGGIKSQTYSEPFLPQGEFSFTSWHSAPTGWQNAYIFPDESAPIGFTIPHGGFVPAGATTAGFAFGDDGYLTWNGTNNFVGCQTDESQAALQTYQIWWLGNSKPAGASCTGILKLYQLSGCSTIG